MSRLEDTRQKALEDLRESGVLMNDGQFDYGNVVITAACTPTRTSSSGALRRFGNYALAEYEAPANYSADECPRCASGQPITAF